MNLQGRMGKVLRKTFCRDNETKLSVNLSEFINNVFALSLLQVYGVHQDGRNTTLYVMVLLNMRD